MDFIDVIIDGISMKKEYGLIRITEGEGFMRPLFHSFNIGQITVPQSAAYTLLGREKTETSRNIKLATEIGLTEVKLKELTDFLYKKGSRIISFDEIPILKRKVVLTQAPDFDFNVFIENGERIYKGFLTLEYQWLNNYRYYESTNQDLDLMALRINNYLEWNQAYGQWGDKIEEKDKTGKIIKSIAKNQHKNINNIKENQIKLYNPGIIETPFYLDINFSAAKSQRNITFSLNGEDFLSCNLKNATGLIIDGTNMKVFQKENLVITSLPLSNFISTIPALKDQESILAIKGLSTDDKIDNNTSSISYNILYL